MGGKILSHRVKKEKKINSCISLEQKYMFFAPLFL